MKIRQFTPLVLTLTLLAAPALAGESRAGDIMVVDPWSRPTPPGTPVGVGYMTIHNHGEAPVTLIAGETPVAGHVSIHETVQHDGVMKMQPLADGLTVPAGGSVELRPHSFHLMLESLSRPLAEGEVVPLTLEFSGREPLEVRLQVQSKDAISGPDDHAHHSHHTDHSGHSGHSDHSDHADPAGHTHHH